jgi:AraC-like DNA-binding protein
MDEVLGENGGELWSEAVARDGSGRKFYPVTLPPPDVVNSFSRVADCNYPNRVKQMFFENMLREILIRVIVHELPADGETCAGLDEFETERIKRVPGILAERLDSLPTIQELARELSMSATKLKRGFKIVFGKPIYAYHRDICLERAAIMLLDTNKRVCEIASDAGYSVSCNFSNAFKKHYGVSPRLYRQKGGLFL